MRIAVGQVWQESNSFNPLWTTWQDFEAFGVLRGADLVEQMAYTNEIGGFIQSLRAWPETPEIVGLVRLPAWPSGPVTAETFHRLRSEMVEAVRRAGVLDGILLALHGAMVAVEHPDVEGEMLEAIRNVVGPNVPLVATLDLHANVTAKMIHNADAILAYHTIPHNDVYETGVRGASVLRKLLHGVRPTMAWRKLPLVLPVERANTGDPASVSYRFREELQAIEAEPGVLAAGLLTVQPWLDIPEMGSSVIVVTENNASRAEAIANDLATRVWHSRHEYMPNLVPVAEAVAEAARLQEDGLIALGDGADSTNSGAAGDGTWPLRELLSHRWTRGALVTMVAPDVVADAYRLGVDAIRTGQVGGVRDRRFSTPIELTAKILRLFDARFVLNGHLAKNLAIDMGPSAVLQAGDVNLIVTTRSGPHFAPELFIAAGFDPFAASVIVAKSPCGFRIAYQDRAMKIMSLQSPGCAAPDFWNYEFRHIPRPMWPWDEWPENELPTMR